MRAANRIGCPLTPKYSASGFSSRGRSIILKHLWNTSRCKILKFSVVLIPESCILGKNPKRLWLLVSFEANSESFRVLKIPDGLKFFQVHQKLSRQNIK